jgi:hypothetical protein
MITDCQYFSLYQNRWVFGSIFPIFCASVCVFFVDKFMNHMPDYNDSWYEYHVIRGHHKFVLFNPLS